MRQRGRKEGMMEDTGADAEREDRATSSYRDLITPPLASQRRATFAFVLLALTREKLAQNVNGAVYIGERT